MLKASRLPRRKDSGGAGTETSTVPFPYQKAKGGIIPRIWVAPRSIALSSQSYGTGAFFCSFYDPITPRFSGKLSNITRKGVFLWQK